MYLLRWHSKKKKILSNREKREMLKRDNRNRLELEEDKFQLKLRNLLISNLSLREEKIKVLGSHSILWLETKTKKANPVMTKKMKTIYKTQQDRHRIPTPSKTLTIDLSISKS